MNPDHSAYPHYPAFTDASRTRFEEVRADARSAQGWLVRVAAPVWLDAAGLTEHAAALRASGDDPAPAIAAAQADVDRSTSETLDLLVATEGLVLSTEPEAWGGCYAAGMMAAADGTSVVHEPAAHAALRLSITAGMLLGYHRRVVDRIALMRTIAATIPGGICEGQTPQEIGANTRAAWLWSQADALASDAQARCPDMRGLDAALAALDGDDT